MFALLRTFSWQELRQHPWRTATALVAIMLGVALGFAVHVINQSALDEFSRAVRTVSGQPNLELRAMQGGLPESLYGRVAQQPQVSLAAPWIEATALAGTATPVQLRVLGGDALRLAPVAPALMPRLFDGGGRLDLFAPDAVFLNATALEALGLTPEQARHTPLPWQLGGRAQTLRIAGTVAASGPPLAVMDIGALQDSLQRWGQVDRIDVLLAEGATRESLLAELRRLPDWPAQALASRPGDDQQRIAEMSRAYRVNLTVLALVALFTGAFLVFSVLALSVAQRAPQFALLAVLGLTPRQRLGLVLLESLLLGMVGSAAGIALGAGLAWLALHLLGGDLGGGYFAGVQPALQWSASAALTFGLLGVAATVAGGWWPARQAMELPPAATLKGQGRAVDQGACNGHALQLAAAELPGQALLQPLQPDGLQQLLHALAARCIQPLQQHQRQGHVVPDIQMGQHMEGLEHEAHMAAPPQRTAGFIQGRQVLAFVQHAALLPLIEPGQAVEKGGLAHARVTHDGHELAARHAAVHVLEDGGFRAAVVAVAPRQALDLKQRRLSQWRVVPGRGSHEGGFLFSRCGPGLLRPPRPSLPAAVAAGHRAYRRQWHGGRACCAAR